jgi:sarcosine oxidase subunit delta
MLRIACPFCGLRDEVEFRCGGQSHIPRPPQDCTDQEWADYLFMRINPRGLSFERWVHAFGCGLWFNVARSTVSHEIAAVYAIGEAAPNLAEPLAHRSHSIDAEGAL